MSKIEIFYRKSPLYPALALETKFSLSRRNIIIKITEWIIWLVILAMVLLTFSNKITFVLEHRGAISFIMVRLYGLFWISVSLYILMHLFEAYFSSVFYFTHVAKNQYTPEDLYTFSAGRILRRVIDDNLVVGILRSKLGTRIMLRLGIEKQDLNLLLMEQSEVKNPPVFNTNSQNIIKVEDIFNFVYDNYNDFTKLLANHGIDKTMLLATVNWSIYQIELAENRRQWWSKANLSRIPGIATDWSYGKTYVLSKFSRNLLNDEEVSSEAFVFAGREKELSQIQTVLSKSSQANVILVGLPGQEKIQVVWNLCKNIRNKSVTLSLLNKRPILFLTNDFIASCTDKNQFEIQLTKILRETEKAGNILLVIDNLPRLISQAQQFESNLADILSPFLISTAIQIIAFADIEPFHYSVEKDKALMVGFETIMIKPLQRDEIAQIISREALEIESIYNIYYTYPAILEITDGADYYFPEGVSGDKAEDLLREITPWAKGKNIKTITREDVMLYIEEKTDIPISAITNKEKERLLDLESDLGKRVIAQRDAVYSIASAIRRSRAGIRNPNRPIGSFLFLGPTGVGKTETAKALANIFFDGEKSMMRLDMSEYQTEDALDRLIGNFSTGQNGVMADMVREKQYGVLLLDEFEKTNAKVLNLFLQILDEGYFSDAFGKKVNARNIIFIATSNAGAEMIFDLVSKGKDLSKSEGEIISSIISRGIMKPELINRFDGTIIFHPLTVENLKEIAKIMLQKVVDRLSNKGMTMTVNQDLIDYIATHGYNPSFGARPMNRLIQDTVEDHLADLIIRNQLSAGQTVEFSITSSTGTKVDLVPKVK